jgi:VTC domain
MKNQKPSLNFRRFEFKYALPSYAADTILASISNFIKIDPYVDNKDFYLVNSIYFDSPELKCYQEKLDGLKNRKKYRIRFYNDNLSKAKPVFFEIKRRSDAIILKNRTIIKPKHLKDISLSNWKDIQKTSPNFFSEFFFDKNQYQLQPKVFIQYKRKPYFSRFQKNFRITFDYDITAAKINSVFPNQIFPQNIQHDTTIMEVKFNGIIPDWFSYIIKSNSLKRISFSKYCNSIEKLYNLDQ